LADALAHQGEHGAALAAATDGLSIKEETGHRVGIDAQDTRQAFGSAHDHRAFKISSPPCSRISRSQRELAFVFAIDCNNPISGNGER